MSLTLAMVAAQAALQKTDEKTVLLDVQPLLSLTDYFVVSSGANPRQIKAIVDEVNRQVKLAGGHSPRQIEGLAQSEWVLVDYGSFIVHVFSNEARSVYGLERLWADAKSMDLVSKSTSEVSDTYISAAK